MPKNVQAGKKRSKADGGKVRRNRGGNDVKDSVTGDLGWKVRRNPSCKVFGFKDLKVS